jgi:pimeloyl-ACP methyl ester carboxylesterase
MGRVLTLTFLAGGIALGPLSAQRAYRLPPAHRRTYVFVHGAAGGGWDWKAVDSLLTRHGHRAVRPTLTGLGERVRLASPEIGLGTHIDDIVNVILWENLHEIILVGHSYGGVVITGVADRVPERIRRLVYLDALLPDSGETALQLADSIGVTYIRPNVRGGFIVLPAMTDNRAVPRDVPQPLRTFTDTLRLSNSAARRVPGSYILTVERDKTPDQFQFFADRAAARGWRVYQLAADHTPERSAPAALVRLLERVHHE